MGGCFLISAAKNKILPCQSRRMDKLIFGTGSQRIDSLSTWELRPDFIAPQKGSSERGVDAQVL